MFKVDREQNDISKLKSPSFSELNLRERDHLQEWFAKNPSALGEELLIIQKEFSGFAETNERLDLLALDKNRQLVIIENKLDDSGRDVTWQALKYAAYCSSLKKSDIVQIFQDHIEKHQDQDDDRIDATTQICNFLDVDELEGVTLNESYDQRIILIAAKFRTEVTAAVLWLREHNINAECHKVTPYSNEDELYIDIQQIIPVPEASDFMVSMVNKEQEQKTTKSVQRHSHQLRLKFWSQALPALRASGLSRYETVNPTKDHWLNCGTGMSACIFCIVFAKREIRVEVAIQRSEAEVNKLVFDKLYSQKEYLEEEFGLPLEWLRLNEKISSKIVLTQPFDGFDEENWPEMIDWLVQHMSRLQCAFEPAIKVINSDLKRPDAP
ncbi:MAG: DUF4268 domain-containing protein [Lentilitoribacter sp.]